MRAFKTLFAVAAVALVGRLPVRAADEPINVASCFPMTCPIASMWRQIERVLDSA